MLQPFILTSTAHAYEACGSKYHLQLYICFPYALPKRLSPTSKQSPPLSISFQRHARLFLRPVRTRHIVFSVGDLLLFDQLSDTPSRVFSAGCSQKLILSTGLQPSKIDLGRDERVFSSLRWLSHKMRTGIHVSDGISFSNGLYFLGDLPFRGGGCEISREAA